MNMHQPKNTPSHDVFEQARHLAGQERFDEAKSLLEPLLSEQSKAAAAAHELGVITAQSGDGDNAINYFDLAVKIDPQQIKSYTAAADLLEEKGLTQLAISCYGSAIAAKPSDTLLKEKFVRLSRASRFLRPSPHIKALYLLCLQSPDVDVSSMGMTWLSLLKQDPVFKKPFKALNQKKYKSFRKKFFKLSDHKFFTEPYFIIALKNQVRVPDIQFERFLTHLRRILLEELQKEERFLSRFDFITVAQAVAHYAYHTEYVFALSEEEKEFIKNLKETADSEEKLAVLGCYINLFDLPHADQITQNFRHTAISDLVDLQLVHNFRLREIKNDIPSLTATEDNVSLLVKEQYEEFPYPRWTSFAKTLYDEKIEGRLSGKKIKILNAGCGTGHEAIELANAFPDADVLAIDLSFASLAYGASKAEDFRIKNINFKQADILNLGDMDQTFDYIASTGVLHHMKEPEAGWKVLTRLLKPGGLMRVCLYSQKGRRALAEARRIIREKGYGSTAEDIRHFRRNASKILKRKDYKAITGFIDYYSLSECRDLLFHVQEHRLELPEIKRWIDDAGMKFLGFFTSKDILQDYRRQYPQDPDATDLDLWHKYEQDHPDTFSGMYRMWIEKP